MLTGNQLRQKFLDFFAARGHKIIPSASLVPQNDSTTLFTSAGMQPMMSYLLGQVHPLGTRLVNSQKCFRSQDIEEVGDNRHTTFFEMLGNWSFGDYFKKEQITWFFTFLTKELGLPKEKLAVSVFEGNDQIPRDEESAQIWKELGIPEERILYYSVEKNWWSRSGVPDKMPAGEPGGPDSEVFFEFTNVNHDSKFGEECHPNCDCGRFLELGNSVFMKYKKETDGSFTDLPKNNIDFGGGLERLGAAVNNNPDIFRTDLFWPIIQKIEDITGQKYQDHSSDMRIIADHIKAAVFLVSDDVTPSNKAQGYVLRRLIRRVVNAGRTLGITTNFTKKIIPVVIEIYEQQYLNTDGPNIVSTIDQEETKFRQTLEKGLNELYKFNQQQSRKSEHEAPNLHQEAEHAFNFYQSYGLPIDVYLDELKKIISWGYSLETRQKIVEEFNKLSVKHQEISRSAAAGMFKGGLADQSETVTKYHTVTHLLQQALRDVLGDHVHQAGSNLTSERLRFDFTHDKALTATEINEVERIINEKITANLPVTKKEMPYDEAIKAGALAFFKEKYPQRVSVYQIGDYSKELCGGPHLAATAEIGKIKIVKQESLGSSLRRVYLKLAS